MTNVTLAGAPLKINEVEFEMTQPDLEDFEYLDAWLKGHMIRAGQLACIDEKDANKREEVITSAAKAAMESSIFSGTGFQHFISPLGATRLLHRLLRKKNPNITVEQCFKWLTDDDLRVEIMPKILEFFKSKSKKRQEGEDQEPRPSQKASS